MNGISEPKHAVESAAPRAVGHKSNVFGSNRAFRPFAIAVLAITAAFGLPLFSLLRYSFGVDLYSHIALIPVICGYLVWIDRSALPSPSRSLFPAAITAFIAAAVLVVYFSAFRGAGLSLNDKLSFTTLSYYGFLLAAAFAFLGTRFLRAVAFPAAFLVFIVPFPDAVTNALEIASQKASADVYDWMMWATGATYLRDGQLFELPGLKIVVAQECSGIRSSFVLFLTSLLAGHMFLRSAWRKAFFSFFVIPLGLIRNGFRVYVISMLSAHWNPDVIHSPLHHKGGPIFFVLSLIPFFILLAWLRRTERSRSVSAPVK